MCHITTFMCWKIVSTNKKSSYFGYYGKLLKSAFLAILKQERLGKWQKERQNALKGPETNNVFSTVNKKLKIHITLTSQLTTMLTGH